MNDLRGKASGSESPMRRALDYGRDEMHQIRRWIRRHTSRDDVVSGLKTLMWVVPLTLLIWVYAEGAQETPQRSVPILISVKSNDPNRVVKLVKESVVMADLS